MVANKQTNTTLGECQYPCQLDGQTRQRMYNANRCLSVGNRLTTLDQLSGSTTASLLCACMHHARHVVSGVAWPWHSGPTPNGTQLPSPAANCVAGVCMQTSTCDIKCLGFARPQPTAKQRTHVALNSNRIPGSGSMLLPRQGSTGAASGPGCAKHTVHRAVCSACCKVAPLNSMIRWLI